MKNVLISIDGTQKDASGQTERIELITDGEYGIQNGRYCLRYDESDLTGLKGTKTTFSVGNKCVVMSREGSLNSQMLFETGRKHYCLYETPYGSTTLGVKTHKIQSDLNEHGGNLILDYDINVEQNLIGRNQFKIHVKENNTNV